MSQPFVIDLPIDMPDGTLRCKRHHLEICPRCRVDYTYMRDILREEAEESEESSEDGPYVDEEARRQKSKQTRCAVCRQPATKQCSRCKKVYYCSVEHQRENWKEHKSSCAEPETTNPSKPRLLLMSLGGNYQYTSGALGNICWMIKDKMAVVTAVSAGKAIGLLNSSKPPYAVLIADLISPEDHSALLDSLVQYARDGGTVIFGIGFPSFTIPGKFREIFTRFGLPWISGDYGRQDFGLNTEFLPKKKPKQKKKGGAVQKSTTAPRKELSERALNPLPETYNMKALQLKNVSLEHAIYLNVSIGVEGRRESGGVFESPATFAPVGNGWVGYLGDVNAGYETESGPVLQAMIGPRKTEVEPSVEPNVGSYSYWEDID